MLNLSVSQTSVYQETCHFELRRRWKTTASCDCVFRAADDDDDELCDLMWDCDIKQ